MNKALFENDNCSEVIVETHHLLSYYFIEIQTLVVEQMAFLDSSGEPI